MPKKYAIKYVCVLVMFHTIKYKPVLATYVDANNSDIFITYSGHSEVENPMPISIPKPNNDDKRSIPKPDTGETKISKAVAEDVIFIPNEEPNFRIDDDYLENDGVKLSEVVNTKRLSDVIRDDTLVADPTTEGIVFIAGKNHEHAAILKSEKKHKHDAKTKKREKIKRMNCDSLDCDTIVASVCGGKVENKEWRYRLFLNECFFRKVNCAFKNPANMYKLVALEKCSRIGSHAEARPIFHPLPLSRAREDNKDVRINFASRRSLNADITGLPCSHACPVACTERYEPQCAMSPTGHRHTFLNHCKLDHNSCVNGVVWRIRPLSECVGERKADLQQNKGFVAWMQKVGIVDNRGRLTLSKPRNS